MKGKWILKCIAMALLTVLAVLGFGYLFMCLWNWLMPVIFGLGMINFWQGIGLLVLGKMLFGGFHKKMGRCGCGHSGGWKNRWEEKMVNMSPEERENFKLKIKKRWGNCGYKDSDTEEVKP